MAGKGLGRAFPAGFTWGTATAAHQIEGGQLQQRLVGLRAHAGLGLHRAVRRRCDSWNRWEEDADLVAGLGLDNYRFSVEWSRIEPAEGEISHAALAHYRRQCLGLRERGVDPVVTFHHFTTPQWLTAQGGWETDLAVERFGRFCGVVTEALGDVMARACTLNEPNIVATMGWHAGMFPPGKKDLALSRAVAARFAAAHRVAVETIRAGAPGVPVGLTLSMTDYQLAPGGEEKLESIRHHAEDVFLDVTEGDDFLGRAGLHPHADRARRLGRLRGRRPRSRHGLRVLPGLARQLPAPGLGLHGRLRPASRHRERDRHHRRRAAHRLRAPGARPACCRPSPTASTCGATPTGRCSTTSSGPWATSRSSGSSRSTARRFARTPKAERRLAGRRSRRPTRSTPEADSDGGELRVGHDGVGDGVPEGLGQVVAHARDA